MRFVFIAALWLAAAIIVGASGALQRVRPPGLQLILIALTATLLVGWRLHWWAFAAAALLLSFALAMTGALGVKAPTDYSVWTAAAAAFLLGVVALREHGTEGTRKFDAEARKPEQYAQARVTQKGAS